MSEWLCGRHAVIEALAGTARQVHEVALRRGARRAAEDVRAACSLAGVPWHEHDEAAMAALCGQSVAVAARASAFRYRDEGAIPTAGDRSFVVVVDQIQDPQNLGAIVRTAEAAGAAALFVGTRGCAQVTPAVVRASAGATEHLPIHRAVNIARLLARLRDSGYWTVGLAPAATTVWYDVDYRHPTALVVGAEGKGLRRLVAEGCDHLVALRMAGRVGSLNASAAFAAVAYEVARQQCL